MIRKNPWRDLFFILLLFAGCSVSAQPGGQLSGMGPSYFPDYTLLDAKPYPFDGTRPLELRVRSYLDANCSQCHQPGGISNGGMDFRYSTPLDRTGLFSPSTRSAPDGGRLYHVTPGNIQSSEVYLRLAAVGSYAMPPMGRTQVDEKALALLRDWIHSLSRHAQSRTPAVSERKSPYILDPRQQELEISGTDLGSNSDSAQKLEVEILDFTGERISGVAVIANENPRHPGWILRGSQLLPRGRYAMRMRWGARISTHALLVL